MRRRVVAVTVGIASFGAIAMSGEGCGSDTPRSDPDAGPTGVISDDHSSPAVDAGVDDDGAPADATVDPYASLDGWARNADYGQRCKLYLPLTLDAVPPLFEWAPCPAAIWTADGGCSVPSFPAGYAGYAGVDVHDGGATLCGVATNADFSTTFHIVKEVDGPVRSGLRNADTSECILDLRGCAGGRYLYKVDEAPPGFGLSFNDGGALAGNVGDPAPSVFLHFGDGRDHQLALGADFGILDQAASVSRAFSWAPPHTATALPPFGNGGNTVALGATLFVDPSGRAVDTLSLATLDAGTQPFIDAGVDLSQQVAEFGTDGVDMVWLHVSGPDASATWDVVDVMTSKFTLDPRATAASPPALRSTLRRGHCALQGGMRLRSAQHDRRTADRTPLGYSASAGRSLAACPTCGAKSPPSRVPRSSLASDTPGSRASPASASMPWGQGLHQIDVRGAGAPNQRDGGRVLLSRETQPAAHGSGFLRKAVTQVMARFPSAAP